MSVEEQSATSSETIVRLHRQAQEAIGGIVVGLEHATTQLLIALVADGHVLLEGVPGTAKTTLCKAFARLLGIEFQRVQFTPDLLPSDVIGSNIFDRRTNDFVLRRGPIFCQILLVDELNRAPAKTQSALLEAMQERQVTIDGATLPLPRPFLVLATQNPVEQEGVYRLPEAQVDRFLLRVEVGYPARGEEIAMLELHNPPPPLPDPLCNGATVHELQEQLYRVHASREVQEYVVDLARASREHGEVALGASPRAALYLLRAARARALLEGRDYCTHEDVQEIAIPVLGHRIILQPEAEVEGRRPADVIRELLRSVPVLRASRKR